MERIERGTAEFCAAEARGFELPIAGIEDCLLAALESRERVT